jgi:TPR repeat protein
MTMKQGIKLNDIRLLLGMYYIENNKMKKAKEIFQEMAKLNYLEGYFFIGAAYYMGITENIENEFLSLNYLDIAINIKLPEALFYKSKILLDVERLNLKYLFF